MIQILMGVLLSLAGAQAASPAQAAPVALDGCARQCVARWADGSCRDWGQDYCGPQAVCARKCAERWTDGSCREWGGDYCGPNAECSAFCEESWTNGSCRAWGADRCDSWLGGGES